MYMIKSCKSNTVFSVYYIILIIYLIFCCQFKMNQHCEYWSHFNYIAVFRYGQASFASVATLVREH